MSTDKKKVIVLASLFTVILGVGAFQFLGGSPEAPPPAAPKAEKRAIAAKPEEKKDAPKYPQLMSPLAMRDPFASASAMAQAQQPQPHPVSNPTPDPEPRPLPPVDINKTGPLGSGNAPVFVTPSPEIEFGYSLSGVMLGRQKLAVFNDPSGEQRLVPVGGSLDAETKVISISKDAVTVRFHGKTKRMTVEGNPNDK